MGKTIQSLYAEMMAQTAGIQDSLKPENMGSQNQAEVHKVKGYLQYPKDNSTRWTEALFVNAASFHSTYPNTEYSERTHVNTWRPDNDGRPQSKMSQNISQLSQDRFSGHYIGRGFKQKAKVSGKMSFP